MHRTILSVILVFCFTTASFGQQSVKLADSLSAIVRNSANDSLRIEALYKLSGQYTMLDLAKAVELNKSAFDLSKGKYRDLGLAKSYNIKGIIHDIRGEADSAYHCYRQAVHYSTKSKVYSTQASALNNLGLLEWNKSNYLNAIRYYDQALRVFEKIGNKEGQGNTMSNMGMIYGTLGESEKEKKFSFAALEIRKELNDVYGMSVSYVNIGRHYELQSDFKTAIRYYQNAIKYKRQIDDKRGLAITNNNVASLLMQEKRNDEAAQYLRESAALAKEIGAKQIAAYAWFGLTSYYVNKQQPKLAADALGKARSFVESDEDNDAMTTYLRHAEQIALLNKNYAKAYEYLKERTAIEKKIEDIEVRKAVSEVETKYQTEKKEKELAREKVKVSERELKIREKNNLLIIIALLFASAVLTGYLFYNQQKLKNRQLTREAELKTAMAEIETQNHLQKQRLHISRDLHDNIGAQLTFIISSLDNLKFMDMPREKINDKIRFLSDFTLSTIYELRDTIWAMNKKDISFDDLKVRITNFIDNAQSTSEGVQFEFSVEGRSGMNILFRSVEGMNIYRIIQEAVNNALKYANASKITVLFSISEKEILFSVTDDGIGFDPEEIDLGNGINNMKKRAKELEATIALEPSPTGTRITVRLPKDRLIT